MEFVLGDQYETIVDINYDELEEMEQEDFSTQEEDPGLVSREFFIHAGKSNWIEDEEITLPAGTQLIKVNNNEYDNIDGYERFIIKNTKVEVVIHNDWTTWDELLK